MQSGGEDGLLPLTRGSRLAATQRGLAGEARMVAAQGGDTGHATGATVVLGWAKAQAKGRACAGAATGQKRAAGSLG